MHELVSQLDSDLDATVVDAIGGLQRVAVHAHDDVRHEIAVSGAIEKLLRLVRAAANSLGSRRVPLVEPAMSALQNLSAVVKPDDWVKDAMDQLGVPQLMLQMIHARVEVAKAISTLMNLIIGSEERKEALVQMGGVHVMAPLFQPPASKEDKGAEQLRFLAMNTFTSLAIGSAERKDTIANALGVLEATVGMINPGEATITQVNALELIQSVQLGSVERKEAIASYGIVPRLSTLLAAGRRVSPEVRELAVPLLQAYAEFLGWQSQHATAGAATAVQAKHEDSSMLSAMLPACVSEPLWLLVGKMAGSWGWSHGP